MIESTTTLNYSAVEKYLLPHRPLLFLLFCHPFRSTNKFKVSDKDDLSEYKMQFQNDDFIY